MNYNRGTYSELLIQAMKTRRKSYRQVTVETGVTHSAICRAVQKKTISTDNFLRLAKWIDINGIRDLEWELL